jgi:hypothetical protein
LGITSSRHRSLEWPAADVALLERMSDGAVARRLALHKKGVRLTRKRLGIAAYRVPKEPPPPPRAARTKKAAK